MSYKGDLKCLRGCAILWMAIECLWILAHIADIINNLLVNFGDYHALQKEVTMNN